MTKPEGRPCPGSSPSILAVCGKWAKEASVAASHLLFPPACLVCGLELPAAPPGASLERWLAERICSACELDLAISGGRCSHCGLPSPGGSDCVGCRQLWGRLHLSVLPWQQLFVLGGYADRLRDMVLQAKRPAGEDRAELLAMLLLRQHGQLAEICLDAVVPVPMHWRRRLARGTNAASVIAKRLAWQLGVPQKNALQRKRLTPLQRSLPAAERPGNVAGSFRLRGRQPPGRQVLLVDDVATTGATFAAAATALLEAGVSVVYAAAVARADMTPAPNNPDSLP